MRKAGIIILVIGLIITCSAGFSFLTRNEIADFGSIQIYTDKKQTVEWPPILGVLTMAAGLGFYIYGTRKVRQ